MAEEAIVNDDTSNVTENTNDNGAAENTEDIPTVDDYRALEEKTKKLEETNKKLYARVKESKPLKTTVESTDLEGMEKRLEKKLELKAQGFNDEDIKFINANGGDVNNPYVKNALASVKVQREAEIAASITSSGQSDIEKKYSNDELRKMSPEELAKILPHA
jgi:small-conductance mechanosensitive channel